MTITTMPWRILRSCSRINLASRRLFQKQTQPLLIVFMSDINNKSNKLDQKLCTVADLRKHWAQRFETEGIAEPIESIEHIITHIMGTSRITDLVTLDGKELDSEQLQKLEALCECRLSRMPVQYIIGEWDFRELTLKLEPPIFIPRSETEILVDFLLKKITNTKSNVYNVLDIGCGSGAISLSLLHSNEKISVVAIDTNPHACELTLQNAENLKLKNRLKLLNATLKEDGTIEIKKYYCEAQPLNFTEYKFDFIVSNPPYIPTKTVFKLQPEVNVYEDIIALDGGDDGLKVIKPILKYASRALKVGGVLIMEVDSTHPERIKYLISKYYASELKFEHVHKDFCNNDRFVEIMKV